MSPVKVLGFCGLLSSGCLTLGAAWHFPPLVAAAGFIMVIANSYALFYREPK